MQIPIYCHCRFFSSRNTQCTADNIWGMKFSSNFMYYVSYSSLKERKYSNCFTITPKPHSTLERTSESIVIYLSSYLFMGFRTGVAKSLCSLKQREEDREDGPYSDWSQILHMSRMRIIILPDIYRLLTVEQSKGSVREQNKRVYRFRTSQSTFTPVQPSTQKFSLSVNTIGNKIKQFDTFIFEYGGKFREIMLIKNGLNNLLDFQEPSVQVPYEKVCIT